MQGVVERSFPIVIHSWEHDWKEPVSGQLLNDTRNAYTWVMTFWRSWSLFSGCSRSARVENFFDKFFTWSMTCCKEGFWKTCSFASFADVGSGTAQGGRRHAVVHASLSWAFGIEPLKWVNGGSCSWFLLSAKCCLWRRASSSLAFWELTNLTVDMLKRNRSSCRDFSLKRCFTSASDFFANVVELLEIFAWSAFLATSLAKVRNWSLLTSCWSPISRRRFSQPDCSSNGFGGFLSGGNITAKTFTRGS